MSILHDYFIVQSVSKVWLIWGASVPFWQHVSMPKCLTPVTCMSTLLNHLPNWAATKCMTTAHSCIPPSSKQSQESMHKGYQCSKFNSVADSKKCEDTSSYMTHRLHAHMVQQAWCRSTSPWGTDWTNQAMCSPLSAQVMCWIRNWQHSLLCTRFLQHNFTHSLFMPQGMTSRFVVHAVS